MFRLRTLRIYPAFSYFNAIRGKIIYSLFYQFILQKPLPVLIGPCVFGGGLYPVKNTEDIEIRMEYAISGPGIDQVH